MNGPEIFRFGRKIEQSRDSLSTVERNAPVLLANRAAPDPDDLTLGATLIEHSRVEIRNPSRQNRPFQFREGKRQPLEKIDRFIET